MQATSPIPLAPRCRTSGAPTANTNPVNTAQGLTIHNSTLLHNLILGHGTGLQEFSVTGNKLVTGSYNFRALWVFGVAFGECDARSATNSYPRCLYVYCKCTRRAKEHNNLLLEMGLYVSPFCHKIYIKNSFLQHHQPRTILYAFTQRTKESITW
jgi:hypothetical protein